MTLNICVETRVYLFKDCHMSLCVKSKLSCALTLDGWMDGCVCMLDLNERGGRREGRRRRA